MIRDITIGQYIDADSPLHKMDARAKIIGVILFIILLFGIESVAFCISLRFDEFCKFI